MNIGIIHFFIVLLSLFSYPLTIPAAEVYMWIDDKGIRHITDLPPEKPAKMIDHDHYTRDSPEEIRRYELQQKTKRQQSDAETERQRQINQAREAAHKTWSQRKDDRREAEIEQARKDLEFEKKYQSKYEDERRNSQSQWRVDVYDNLKKQQDKEVEVKDRRLRELENNR
jgi:molecular chaperone DnaK (HSP70)